MSRWVVPPGRFVIVDVTHRLSAGWGVVDDYRSRCCAIFALLGQFGQKAFPGGKISERVGEEFSIR